MSLGSRISKRGRAAVFASLASTPREPLLFLYPSWIRNSSTTSPAPSHRDGPSLDATTQHTPVTIPKHAATLSDDPAVLHQRFNKPKTAPSDHHPIDTNIVSPKSRPPNIATEDGIASLQEEQNTVKEGTPASRTEKTVQKVLSLLYHNDGARQSASSTRKEYQAIRREELQSWTPDWRVVLSTLIKHTPEHGKWLSKPLKFVIPPGDARKLLTGIDENFQEIGNAYGCQIKLGERNDVTSEFVTLVISGPAMAISKCAAEVLNIAPTVDIQPYKERLSAPEQVEALEDGTEELGSKFEVFSSGVRVRNVMSGVAQRSSKRIQAIRPEDIRRPEVWTQQSLLEYIQEVTTCKVTSHVNRFGLNATTEHDNAAIEILRDLIKDPDVKSSMTREACHEVMQYWVRKNRIQDARILFVYMEILKLRMVPETFNILLAGAAKVEDIHNFHFILHLMLNRGITPNGQTWCCFLTAFPDAKIKLHILTAMQQKGLLNHPQTMIEASAQMATPEIESSLDKNQTQQDFIAHMDSRYTKAWLSKSSANHIIDVLGSRGLISRCWEFLHFMDSRQIVPDNYSVHTILHHCKQSANLAGAIEVLRSLPKSMFFRPTEETYRIMFEIAWTLRAYNAAKIIWRYACLDGKTSFRMRERVFASMKEANQPTEPTTSREHWEKYAGPFIIGITSLNEHPYRFLERMVSDIELERLEARQAFKQKKIEAGVVDVQFGNETTKLWDPRVTIDTKDQDGKVLEDSVASPEASTDSESSSANAPTSTPTEPLARYSPPQNRQLPPTLPFPTRQLLKEALHADLAMFKEWKPTRPFEDMLTVAFERDMLWRAEREEAWRRGEFAQGREEKERWRRERGLEWFLDGRGVRVGVGTGRRGGLVREFEWR